MNRDIWVLGATGRTGRAVAARLHGAGLSLVLVGRNRERLAGVAAALDGAPRLMVGSLDAALAELSQNAPAVVINTVGPFTGTAVKVARACPPGTHYVDVSNELPAVQAVLALDQEAKDTNRTFVTAAGFGVLATESVLLRLCEGQPPAVRARVDAMASVATEAGVIGSALAATIVESAALGGRQVRRGRLVPAPAAGEPVQLTTPDGEVIGTASGASGELIAAWRASRADSVVAASSLLPTSALVRFVLPVVSALVRLPGVGGFAVRRLARLPLRAQDRPRPFSWAHARAEWPHGEVREGWLRMGDAMDFTAGAVSEVARRLARGEGQPGAYTPGALFGPDLAVQAGGQFIPEHKKG